MVSEAPIFVVGYMHSGTTLVMEILRRHSALFCGGGESLFFEALPVIQRRYPDLQSDAHLSEYLAFLVQASGGGLSRVDRIARSEWIEVPEPQALLEAARVTRDHCELFRVVNDHLARLEGKRRWLEKTPSHVFHMESIVHHFPDAQFVEIVRDLRDVLASKKTRRETVWTDRYSPEQQGRKHLEKAYDPFWDTLSWKAAVSAGRSAHRLFPEQLHTIHYERLVANPEAEMQQVFKFLRLPYEPATLDVSRGNMADWNARKVRQAAGITTHSVGRWQGALTGAEIALCQAVARGELKALGYVPSPSSWRDRSRMAPLLVRSTHEFWLRLYRRWKLGGSTYLFSVLGNYWRRLRKLIRPA